MDRTSTSSITSNEFRRRRFCQLMATSAMILPMSGQIGKRFAVGGETPPSRPSRLHIRPRYYRWHVNPGVEWVETNTDHARLDWTIPLEQLALVLVDVWDHHYLKDAEARAEAIIDSRLVPLVDFARQSGMTVIHAPSPTHAKPHANWVGRQFATAQTAKSTAPNSKEWPPREFRSKSGSYAQYGRPAEPREGELALLRAGLKIHPKVLPQGDEPVVANGDELHDYLRRNGKLFLLFAGFNTNACILLRDYGTIEMSKRGYEVILVRDCTTGMESRHSQAALGQTNGAVLFLEMFGQYSITADEIRDGLKVN